MQRAGRVRFDVRLGWRWSRHAPSWLSSPFSTPASTSASPTSSSRPLVLMPSFQHLACSNISLRLHTRCPSSPPLSSSLRSPPKSNRATVRASSTSPSGSSTTGAKDEEVDVLIVGGGMVGSALACSLDCRSLKVGQGEMTKHLRVGLVEGSPPAPLHPLPSTPDLRVSSLNPSTVRFLERIGVWDDILATRVAPFYSMKVWDAQGYGRIEFESREVGEDQLGFIVENRITTGALFSKIAAMPNVKLYCPDVAQSLSLDGQDGDTSSASSSTTTNTSSPNKQTDWTQAQPLAKIVLRNGTRLKARLVVGADGGQSIARKAGQLPGFGWDYRQRGVVSTVRLGAEWADRMTTAWQRFLPTGPVALLPLWGEYASIVWSTPLAEAQNLLELDDDEFVKQLNDALRAPDAPGVFDRILGGQQPHVPEIMSVVGKRGAFPLRMAHATSYCRPRLALIGDAAHTTHPLAGQGANLGFSDADALARTLGDGIGTGRDVGDITVLREYEAERKWRNLAMLAGLDTIKRTFDTNLVPFAMARAIGMRAVGAIPPLKVCGWH